MISCFARNFLLPNTKALLSHISLHHIHLKVFRCINGSGSKSYSPFNSFAKHIKMKHSDMNKSCGNKFAVESEIPNIVLFQAPSTRKSLEASLGNISINCSVEVPVECYQQVPDDEINLFVESSNSKEEIGDLDLILQSSPAEHSELNTITQLPNLQKNEIEKASKFVSKLFNFSEIPRKIVHEIKNDVSIFVNDILNLIEERVELTMQQTENSNIEFSKIKI